MIEYLSLFRPTFVAGIWTLVALVAVALVRVWPRLREINVQADDSLRAQLLARIGTLEARANTLEKSLYDQQERHAVELRTMQQQHGAELRKMDARHHGEMQLLRHRFNNERAALEALLLLLKVSPEKVAEHVDQILEMRADRERTIALESGAMAGAAMAGAKDVASGGGKT